VKRHIAIALLDNDDLALSVQVLQEFYLQANSTRRDALTHDIAVGLIRTWLRFKVQEITVPVILARCRSKTPMTSPPGNVAIIAAAQALGCREFLSEDMSHGRKFDGAIINNPFR